MPRRNATAWLVSLVYSTIVGLWIYFAFDTEEGEIGDATSLLLIPLFLGTGLLLNRWWAVLLAIIAVLLGIAAGTLDGRETPVFVFMLFPVLPAGIALIATSVGVRRLLERRDVS